MRQFKWNIFLSHASEDKDEIARPLANRLAEHGLKVWLDEGELKLGDSLRRKLDDGLANSHAGIVILSDYFFAKRWPQTELDSLISLLEQKERHIFPVWHKLNADDIRRYSPILSGILAASTDKGPIHVADKIYESYMEISTSRRRGQPVFAKRLSLKILSNLPTGAILSSNLCNPDLTPLFTEEIGDEASRRTLWDRMKLAGVSGSKVYVFANWAEYRDHMASRNIWSTNIDENIPKQLNREQPAQFSHALLDSISELHITEHIHDSVLQVLSHPDYPLWMSVGGKLMRNPIWASIPDEQKATMMMSHELNGPSPPTIMHLDMLLIRRNKDNGRGELLTYFSPDWNTHLIRFRQWLPEDNPKLRLEMNKKKMAKHCDGVAGSVSVKRLPNKFAVSVKPHPKYGDLIIYVFEFCSVEFKSEPSFIRSPGASEGLWFDLDSLKADCSSWAVNADVIRAIHELFTVSLGPLPVSYIDRRAARNDRYNTDTRDLKSQHET